MSWNRKNQKKKKKKKKRMAKLIPGFRPWFTLRPRWSRDSDHGLHYSQVDPGIQTMVYITAKLIPGFRPWFTLQPSGWSGLERDPVERAVIGQRIDALLWLVKDWIDCFWLDIYQAYSFLIGQELNRLFSDWLEIKRIHFSDQSLSRNSTDCFFIG